MKHIRIVSPSGHLDASYIEQASTRLHGWGYSVTEGKHARNEWGRFAGTDKERIEDLAEALKDNSVDFILCARGGYGLQRIIDALPPITKPIIGFSDITALHQLAALNKQPSMHSIMCKHIATLPEDSEPILAFRNALKGEKTNYSFSPHPLNRIGTAEGHIIGGNLSVLYGLQDTPFSLLNALDKESSSPILLLEDIGERHYHIDRMIRNLKLSGVLSKISGLIIGQFSDCEDDPYMPEHSVLQSIYDVVADYDYPVIFNAPIGHVDYNLPIWLNCPAKIEVRAEKVRLEISSAP